MPSHAYSRGTISRCNRPAKPRRRRGGSTSHSGTLCPFVMWCRGRPSAGNAPDCRCDARRDRRQSEGRVAAAMNLRRPQLLEPTKDNSTRRFCARPCAVSFEATGLASPNPCAEMRSGLTPCEIRYCITASARLCDSS